MKRAFIAILIVLFFPASVFAKDLALVLGIMENPTTVTAMEQIVAQLRTRNKVKTLPSRTVEIMLKGIGKSIKAVKTVDQGIEAAKAINADVLLWVVGWNEDFSIFTATRVDVKSGRKITAIGNMVLYHKNHRPMLAKGVATVLTEGKAFCPIDSKVEPPIVLEELDWGTWKEGKYTQKRYRSTLMVEIDETGKTGRSWVLFTTKPGHGERFQTMIKKYKILPARLNGKGVSCYALMNAAGKRVHLESKTNIPTESFWGMITSCE